MSRQSCLLSELFTKYGNLRRGGKLAAEHTTAGKLPTWATSLCPRHLGQKAGVGRENPSVRPLMFLHYSRNNELFCIFSFLPFTMLGKSFSEGLNWGLASQGNVLLPPTEAVFLHGVLCSKSSTKLTPSVHFTRLCFSRLTTCWAVLVAPDPPWLHQLLCQALVLLYR